MCLKSSVIINGYGFIPRPLQNCFLFKNLQKGLLDKYNFQNHILILIPYSNLPKIIWPADNRTVNKQKYEIHIEKEKYNAFIENTRQFIPLF